MVRINHALKGTLYEIAGKSPHHHLFVSCDTTFENQDVVFQPVLKN